MDNSKVDWRKYAQQYDLVTIDGANPAYMELVHTVETVLDDRIKPGALVADLGGGTGNFVLNLAQKHPKAQFVIVDFCQAMLDKAKSKAHSKGLKNVDFIFNDVENVSEIVKTYSQALTHVLLIHCLYTTRSAADPQKPARILSNIHRYMEGEDSLLVLSDANRPIKTKSWLPYCLWHHYQSCKSIKQTIQTFFRADQAKIVNAIIDQKQKQGEYLLCSLEEMIHMVKAAGFTRIYKALDNYYRGRDNFIIAGCG